MAGFSPVFSEVTAWIDKNATGPEASKRLADFAAAKRDEVIAKDSPSSTVTFVDGREGAALESVKVPGMILFQFGYTDGIVKSVLDLLVQKSPFAPKRQGAKPPTHYRDEHAVFINGAEVSELPAKIPPNALVTLVNLQPYSRKIERGMSLMAPSGVYEVVARIARREWGKVASIEFGYDIFPGAGPSLKSSVRGHAAKSRRDDRFPSITIKALSA